MTKKILTVLKGGTNIRTAPNTGGAIIPPAPAAGAQYEVVAEYFFDVAGRATEFEKIIPGQDYSRWAQIVIPARDSRQNYICVKMPRIVQPLCRVDIVDEPPQPPVVDSTQQNIEDLNNAKYLIDGVLRRLGQC